MTTQQIAAPFSRFLQTIGHALQARAVRRELEGMDERMLKDLGISRAQAEFQLDYGYHGWNARPWNAGPHHDA